MADEPVRWRGYEGTRRTVAGEGVVSVWAVRGAVAPRPEVFAHSAGGLGGGTRIVPRTRTMEMARLVRQARLRGR